MAIEEALSWYQEQGATIVDVAIPDLAKFLIASSGVIGYEFESDLNEYFETFGSEDIDSLSKIFELSLFHEAIGGRLSQTLEGRPGEAEYAAALEARKTLRQALNLIFETHNLDALVYPTIAQTPVFIGEEQPGNNCSMAAHSGLPALSMPAGFSPAGLPVGMEFLGKRFKDPHLLAIAQAFATSNDRRRPPSVTPPLVNAQPPEPELVELIINENGIRMAAEFSFDFVTNLLSYQIFVDPSSFQIFSAATLHIMSREGDLGAAILNLIGPASEQVSEQSFMNEDLRTAFKNRQLYIRVFGDSLPLEGEAILLQ